MIDAIKPIKDDLYTPKIEGAEDEIREYELYHGQDRFMGKYFQKLLKHD